MRHLILSALCLLAPATAPAEPAEASLARTVEIAAHRRLVAVTAAAGHRPDAFVTDGCSGGLSAAWETLAATLPAFAARHDRHPPWEHCCVTHDRAYHAAGGTLTAEDSYRARAEADAALRACILETGTTRRAALADIYGVSEARVEAAYGLIATAVYDAVRLGGAPCSGLPWRWGFGYPGCFSED